MDARATAANPDGVVVRVPAWFSAPVAIDRNPLRQVLIRAQRAPLATEGGHRRLRLAGPDRARVGSRRLPADDAGTALLLPAVRLEAAIAGGDLTAGRWIGARERTTPAEVLASLRDAFAFRAADPDRGLDGLRPPQLGALHAVLAHWTTRSSEPATVVMPTGTGKTETMLALLAAARPERLLVVVPSDALRSQTAAKFESFGVLQEFGVVAAGALRPVVGQVHHRFATAESARRFAEQCNVVIATPAAFEASSAEVRQALVDTCSHLFVDEAHHVAATTWRSIRDAFGGRPVVQFTATPFREDGRHLGGKLLYAYPLGEAQREGYFASIDFRSVLDLGDHDGAVARRAVEQLRSDLEAGLDHLLMARVNRIGRAGEILPLYEDLAPDLRPVLLHSAHSQREQRAALELIRTRQSRIIVCVNMLGEGFDLPALKIAAIHDAHRSLGVTLQFVGRFARSGDATPGGATVVVGRPGGAVDPILRRLYAEDADWNRLIRDLSEGAVGEVTDVSDFEAAFGSLPDEIAVRSLLPKMSTVAYRTRTQDWDVARIKEIYPEDRLLTVPIAVNERDHVAWFVTETRSPVRWAELQTVEEVAYDLYVVYWNAAQQLLFINSSNNDSLHEALATAICGDVERIVGENVYRVMAGVARLVPTNVGLLDIRNRSRRFSMHVGADVVEGFPLAEAQTKTKTNIFAYGYEAGGRVSIGASLKGRIWSYRVAESLKHWTDWCDHVGAKLMDEGLNVDEVMRHFIRPEVVEERPELVPLALEWPWEVVAGMSDQVQVEFGGLSRALADLELDITEQTARGPIPFALVSDDWSAPYRIEIGDGAMRFSPVAAEAELVVRDERLPFSTFLAQVGLYIHLEHEAVIMPPALLLRPPRDLPPFEAAALQPVDWSGINLAVESRGPDLRPDSIQARMIENVESLAAWDIVIDDDGSGEIADIVALRVEDDGLALHFTHCKYVPGGQPRAQVEDLYVVCGQAQKSARWRRNVSLLLQRLIGRERRRLMGGRRSGFVQGDIQSLYRLSDGAHLLRPSLTIAIAQPGLSKAGVSAAQLELLASTETYVRETANSGLQVFCSA